MNSKATHRSHKYYRYWEFISIVCITAIIAINAFLAFQTIDDQSRKHQSIMSTGNVIAAIKNLHQAMLLVESGQRGYLLTDREQYLTPYYEALDNLNRRIEVVKNIKTEIPEQAQRIDDLMVLIDKKVNEMVTTVNLGIDDKDSRAIKMVLTDEGYYLYVQMAILIEQIEESEFALQAKLYDAMILSQKESKRIFLVFIIASAILIVLLLVLINISIYRERKHRLELEQRAQLLEDTVKERTQELVVYSEKLVLSNRELEEFAFVASHDLQEPLRKIRTFSDRIQRLYSEKIDEKGTDYLLRMNNAATRMSNLIQDLLTFSRIKTRGEPFSRVDLNKLIGEVLDDLEVAIESSNAEINIDSLPEIEGDDRQMGQLFLNLLSNSLKFRKPNVAPVINIRYSEQSIEENGASLLYHRISIKDNGIGFDQSYADKIFMPFQRLHAREEYDGTGIGLAICRRIVERHNGSISVVTSVGQGSEFTFVIPIINIQLDEEILE